MIFVPLLSHVIYPALRKSRIMPGRITRITFGFYLAICSSLTGTILQWRIYKTSPCGYQATTCKKGDVVSPISVWAQIPIFMLGAMSECFCHVTAYEIVYARSPKGMKALVMSIFLSMSALSSAFAQITVPILKDPYLVWVWGSPPVALFVLTFVFYWQFRWMNEDDFMTYEEEYEKKTETNAVQEGIEVKEVAEEKRP
jgi:dipeptide/tripeptide permease